MGNLNKVKTLVLLCILELSCCKEALGMTTQEAALFNSLIEEAVAKVQQLNSRVVNNQDLLVTIAQSAPRWKRIEGSPMKFVSVGANGVWGVDQDNGVYYRSGTFHNEGSSGTGWESVDGSLKQIAAGQDVWGVDSSDRIFIRTGITSSNPTGTSWQQIAGGLKQIDVSSNAEAYSVWGVNSRDRIFRRTMVTKCTPTGAGWQMISGYLKFVSTGPAGVWGVNVHNNVYYRAGTYGNEGSAGTTWVQVREKHLKQVSSGDNIVWGVDNNDDVFIREGISASTPTGTGWRQAQINLKQVEANPRSEMAWGINSTDNSVLQRITGVPLQK
ncbi:perivitellin-2 31 kDa subunit-like [Branchiostoma floridae x Branchiostoma belcheri]